MTPALAAYLESNPPVLPLIRLFHVNFGTTNYYLNESEIPYTFGGIEWTPTMGWVSADPIEVASSPFESNPAYYTVWSLRNDTGTALSQEAFNNPSSWWGKTIRQAYGVKGFPNDILYIHIGRMVDVRTTETIDMMKMRIRAETVAAFRNYTPLGEYTPRDQARKFPGVVDKGLDFVATLPGKRITGWLR